MSDTTLPSIPHGCTNPGERRVWLLATAAAGGAAALATAVPFVSTFAPSERAKAMGAAVTVDIGDLPPGGMKTVEWRGKPVWILRRTPEMLAGLPRHEAQLADPASAKDDLPSALRNAGRSARPEIFVAIGASAETSLNSAMLTSMFLVKPSCLHRSGSWRPTGTCAAALRGCPVRACS